MDKALFYGDALPSRRSVRNYKKWLKSLRLLLKKDKFTLLDVGCSSGAFLSTAKHYGCEVVGVEPAKKAAKVAQNNGVEVYPCLLHQAKLTDNSFDAITIFEVVEHLVNPADLMKECYRLLKPNGILLIGTGNTDSWTVRIMKEKWDYFGVHNDGHVNFFNIDSLKKLTHSIGFTTEKIQTHGIKFANRNQAGKLNYRILKTCSEMFAFIVVMLNKGHQMHVYSRKNI